MPGPQDPSPDPNDRRGAILRAIVSHYVRTGEPVGSKTLVDEYRLGVSSATVRNEMAALEEAGYISHPHTSAGRVPTDTGYRFFVDSWGGGMRVQPSDARRIRQFHVEPTWALEDALRHTAGLLSDLTHHAAVVFAPGLDRSVVRHTDVVRLAGARVMLVVVADTGRVENHVIVVDEGLSEVALAAAGERMDRIARDLPLHEVPAAWMAAAGELEESEKGVLLAAAGTLGASLSRTTEERLFLEGTANIVDEQKFADLETVRRVVAALEHRRIILEVLADALSAGRVSVRIGSENEAEEMQFCSVVTAPYGGDDLPLGSLGIVGPTRMDYRRTIAAVYEVANHLGRVLRELGV